MDRLKQQVLSQGKKRRKTNRPKLSVIAAYSGVFVLLVSFVNIGYQPPKPTASDSNLASQSPLVAPSVTPTPEASKSSVDELVATNIATNIAESSNMMVSPILMNMEVDLEIKKSMDQTSDASIVKPDIAQIGDSRTEIVNHTVKDGETLESIAAQYGVSVQTIQWSNSLTGTTVSAGKVLVIPPVDGFTYKVKASDTIETLATTFKTSVERIRSLNNLEKGGLTPGAEITIPGGDLPANQRPGYVAPAPAVQYNYGYARGFSDGNFTRVNPYDYLPAGVNIYSNTTAAGYNGQCTWYAYFRRLAIGRAIPNTSLGNAVSWAWSLGGRGYAVSNKPSVGSIIQNGGGAGHVGVVEQLNPDGSILISEMNYYPAGNYVVDLRTIPAHAVGSFNYIH